MTSNTFAASAQDAHDTLSDKLRGPLEPDKQLIGRFFAAILRHAFPNGFLSMRAFYDDGKTEPFKPLLTVDLRARDFRQHALDVAQDVARRAAQHPRKVVVCPPMAAFRDEKRAREEDIVQALALSVDCDTHPNAGWARLEEILGSPTVVVRSGGTWKNGGDVPEDKVHLYWRLAVPASDPSRLAKLKEARRWATTIVGGDVSNVPNCHCLRLPGSWHRKDTPRLCDIAVCNDAAEIDLDAALEKLKAVVPQRSHTRTMVPVALASIGERSRWASSRRRTITRPSSAHRRAWQRAASLRTCACGSST